MLDEFFINAAINSHGNAVLRAAVSITGNKADAEDVFSDVFFALYKNGKNFESESHLKAWLIKAAINKAKNIRMSAWSRRRAELDENIAAPERESHDEVFAAIKRLKKGERAIVYLYYYEGYSLKEIAEMLKSRESSVRSKVSRARNSLKKFLSEENK